MKSIQPSSLIVTFAAILAAILAVTPHWLGFSPQTGPAAGVIVLAVTLWATALVPEYLTAMGFFFVAMVLALAPANIVFSGFHSSATWLIFGGMILGLGVNETGLGARAAAAVFRKVPTHYAGIIALTAGLGLVLSFAVPSAMGRVMLLSPVVLAAADALGFSKNSAGRTGIALAGAAGTVIPAFTILPSNVPNVVLLGSAENLYGITFAYAEYFLLNFTVMGIFGLVVPVIVISVLFHDEPSATPAAADKTPWTGNERRLLTILAVTLGFWVTDQVHGISPAWIALGAAIYCLAPRFGVIVPGALTGRVNYGPWFFVAGVIGVGALARHSGAADLVAGYLMSLAGFEPGADARNFAAMVAIGSAMSLLTTHPAVPAIMTPLAQPLADASGWPIASVLMAQVSGWMLFLFPYQMPPMLVALNLAGIPVRRVLPFTAIYFVSGVVIMLPLHYLWGRYLGWFP